MAWEYSRGMRRYRDTETGRVLSPQQMVGLREQFMARMKERAAAVPAGEPKDWERRMRELVKQVNIDLAALGRGGRAQMSPRDWGRVGAQVKSQYRLLGGFADDLAGLTPAQTAARSALYVSSATVSYERAHAAAARVPDLPEFPGDGNQECQANCRCWWEIEATADGFDCTWHAESDAGTCPDCAGNARQWSPLSLAREEASDADRGRAMVGTNGA